MCGFPGLELLGYGLGLSMPPDYALPRSSPGSLAYLLPVLDLYWPHRSLRQWCIACQGPMHEDITEPREWCPESGLQRPDCLEDYAQEGQVGS